MMLCMRFVIGTLVLLLLTAPVIVRAETPTKRELSEEQKLAVSYLLEVEQSLEDAERTQRIVSDGHSSFRVYSWAVEAEYMSRADVVLVGEHHDDPATHRMELSLFSTLSSIRRSRKLPTCLALEMFERDVQLQLEEKSELVAFKDADFLANSRAWPNFVRDYQPLVWYARFQRRGLEGETNWDARYEPNAIFASNAPTPIARRVAKEGLEPVLASLTPEERAWVAETTTAPKDEYWRRFVAAMGGGASAEAHSSGMIEETLYRYYQAQCLKDDTMAETIARLRAEDPQRQVVHLSGSFHIDYHLGIYPRLKQRRPDDKIVTVAIRPVVDFAEATLQAALEAEPGVADYVVFVIKEEKPEA
jgi:uncharacterized iron-regulated protein